MHPGSVIARNEAIHRRSRNGVDCHGAARLAMTDLAVGLAMTDLAVGLAMTQGAVIAPRFCHCEERSNPSAVVQRHRLPRRCAPRNDGLGCAPRSDGLDCAPRNDGRGRHCAPVLSLRPCLVIARNEAIHRPSHNGVDCHGAGRLAMTDLTARLAMTDLAARLKMTQR